MVRRHAGNESSDDAIDYQRYQSGPVEDALGSHALPGCCNRRVLAENASEWRHERIAPAINPVYELAGRVCPDQQEYKAQTHYNFYESYDYVQNSCDHKANLLNI
jgi:hypothetical protein